MPVRCYPLSATSSAGIKRKYRTTTNMTLGRPQKEHLARILVYYNCNIAELRCVSCSHKGT